MLFYSSTDINDVMFFVGKCVDLDNTNVKITRVRKMGSIHFSNICRTMGKKREGEKRKKESVITDLDCQLKSSGNRETKLP